MPDVEIRVYEEGAITRRVRPGFAVADLMGDIVNRGFGDSPGMDEWYNVNPPDAWNTQRSDASFDNMQNVDFIRFLRDGTVLEGASARGGQDNGGEYSGWILRGVVKPLDGHLQGEPLPATNPSYNFDPVTWVPTSGTLDTICPPVQPFNTGVLTVANQATASAISEETYPANQQFQWEIDGQGFSPEWQAAKSVRLGFGNDSYCVYLRHGNYPQLQKSTGYKSWITLKTIHTTSPIDLMGGKYLVKVRRIAGRFVWTVNDKTIHYNEVVGGSIQAASWPAGKLSIEAQGGLRAGIKAGLITYSSKRFPSGTDAEIEGTLRRTVTSNGEISGTEAASPPMPLLAGWQGNNTSIEATTSIEGDHVQYNVTLKASPDYVDTPLLNRALLQFEPQWVEYENGGNGNYIDLRPAVLGLNIEHAMPPVASGSEARIEVHRKLLDEQLPNWLDYVQEYRPILIRIRRRYSDGSADPYWVNVFFGYIHKTQKSSEAVNRRTMTIIARDGTTRLQKPAAVIDYRDAPLDFLASDIDLKTGSTIYPNGHKVYGVDCVYEILKRHLGPTEAGRLNGGYPAHKLDYFTSHYPIYDTTENQGGYLGVALPLGLDTVPSGGAFMFPPPFDEDAISWIEQFKKIDHAEFFYGWPGSFDSETRLDGAPMPMYGRIVDFLRAQSIVTVTDQEYLAGDLEKLIKKMSTETRPESDFNRVVVMGKRADGDDGGLLPAYVIAEARIPTNQTVVHADDTETTIPSPRSPEGAWERTMTIRSDIALSKPIAQAMADSAIYLMRYVDMDWPDIVLRGDARWYWGDRATLKLQGVDSDTSIRLNGKTFRVERVVHVINFESEGDADPFTTTLTTAPITPIG